jgi:hypothetical protein
MLQHSSRIAGLIEPCLPTPAKAPPCGPDWLHEIKHDGFRILARRDAKGVRLITQRPRAPFPCDASHRQSRASKHGLGVG